MKRITGEKPQNAGYRFESGSVSGLTQAAVSMNERMVHLVTMDDPHREPSRMFVVQVTEMDEYRVVCQDKVIAVCSSGARAQRAIARYDRLHPVTPTTSRGFKIEYVWLDEGVGEDD